MPQPEHKGPGSKFPESLSLSEGWEGALDSGTDGSGPLAAAGIF